MLVSRLQAIDLVVGSGDRGRIAGQQAVDAAEHRILLMQDGGDLERACRKQRRKGRIAAEADDHVGPELAVECLGIAPAGKHRAHRFQPADRAAAQPSGREDMDGHAVEQAGNLGAAGIGDQPDAVAARFQFRGERMRRDHMPAGAAGRQNHIHAVARSPLHFTT